ncbi:MAG: glycosyltransferase family 4 protein [Asticcacaulis sp.]
MKILHLTPTYAPAIGGIETVVANLISESARHGIQADVMHVAPDLSDEDVQTPDGHIVFRRRLWPNRFIGFFKGLKGIAEGYDLLHVHDPQISALTLNVIASRLRLPVILSTHGGFFHTGSRGFAKQLHWKIFAPVLLKRYDEVLASSLNDAKIFSEIYPSIGLAANGVDVNRFEAIPLDRERTERRWIYWGRLSVNKRLNYIVDLIYSLRRENARIKLTIAGPDFDNISEELQSAVTAKDLSDQIEIRGKMSEAELEANAAANGIYVTASAHEGFGLTIIEAMAAGLVVVCTNIAPLNQFVRHGHNGFLLNYDGSEEDEAAIRDIAQLDASSYAVMSDNARVTAREYSWQTAYIPFLESYKRLVEAERNTADV